MSDSAVQSAPLHGWRRRAALTALLGLVAVAWLLGAPSRSEAACGPSGGEYDFLCTTKPSGTVTLMVPKGEFIAIFVPEFDPIKDCTWHHVVVDFDDGTSETIEWDAELGLTRSHTFPAPGQYVVTVEATEGTHNNGGEPCPSLNLDALVIYPELEPEEPSEEEPEGEEEPEDEEGPTGGPTGGGADGPASGGSSNPSTGSPGSDSTKGHGSSWRRCAGNIAVRRVRCAKVKEVVHAARAALRRKARRAGRHGRRVKAAGFNCRLRRQGKRRLFCRRHARRILAPA